MDKGETAAVEFFKRYGTFCRTGNGTSFTLEAFHSEPERLEALLYWAGNIYEPRPSHPTQWCWRLYGAAAVKVWAKLRELVSEEKRERGDAKLLTCAKPFPRRSRLTNKRIYIMK